MKKVDKKQPAGDRSYIQDVLGSDRPEPTQSDIAGFKKVSTEEGDEYLAADDAMGVSREEAIRAMAKAEGIQNPEGDLENLLKQLNEKRKKKSMPYEPKIDRPGI